jgi:acyl-CoA synthetase (AMP-forming)/AMP-acid ligase II
MLSVKGQQDSSNPTSVFDLIFTKNPNNILADAPIYTSHSETLTFGQLAHLIRKCAYNLKAKYNIQKGDVVAIRSHSHINYPVLVHATFFVGGTVAFVKHFEFDTVEGITKDLETAQPKILLTDFIGHEVSLKAAANVGIPASHILALGDSSIDSDEGKIDCVQNVLLSGEDVLSLPYRYTDDELENYPAYLCFTSGTTGKSKAAIITTNAILDTVKDACKNDATYGRILTFKAFHAKSSIVILLIVAIIKGAQVCLSCESPVDEIYQDIQKYKISFLIGSPYNIAVMVLYSEYISKNYDFSSVKYVYMGGSAASKELVKDTATLFDAVVGAYYGSSEIRMPFITTPKSSAIGSIGTLKPNAEIRLVDEDGNDAEVGEPGELLVKGQGITKGYYNNPEATAKAFTKDGYYRTGDIMKQDADGFFWFLSRCSHLIKCYPMSFYAYEVEDVVKSHPRVFECVVIGVFQKKLSREYPRAYVTLVDDYNDKEIETIANDIIEYANKQLSELKQIRCGVVIKKSFDRMSTGKVNYAILKQEAEKVE